MNSWAPSLAVIKLTAKQVISMSFPRREARVSASTYRGSAGCSTIFQRFTPPAIISAFHQNVRNRKMREELAMNKVKDVAELYVLADRCARAEEGRKYTGEDAGAETDSTDKDTAAPKKKGRRRNRKRKGKI